MQELAEERHPETEVQKPYERRRGSIPQIIKKEIKLQAERYDASTKPSKASSAKPGPTVEANRRL